MKNVVDGIARMYGEHTEVVLHSLDAEAPEIIKIANGHVTERGEGAPITNLARMKLLEGKDVSDSYLTKTASGKTLHSITTIVRNPKISRLACFVLTWIWMCQCKTSCVPSCHRSRTRVVLGHNPQKRLLVILTRPSLVRLKRFNQKCGRTKQLAHLNAIES